MPIIGPFGFKGGWNTKESAWTLPPNSLTDSQNINSVHDDIVKRGGNVVIQTVPATFSFPVTGIVDWLANSTTRYQLVVSGSKIYQMSTLSGLFTDITGSATITSGANNLHTFASLNNILAICGGSTPDTPLQWTGSGNVSSLSGSPPVGNIVEVANNFMFISGIAATPSRVFWSNASDPNTWPVTSFIDFRASDGDSVTGIINMDQQLIIFKRRSIGLFGTQTSVTSGVVTLGPLTEISADIGIPGPLCVERIPDGRICFLGTNGHVYMMSGGRSLDDISDPPPGRSNIQPTFDALNINRLPYASVRCHPSRTQIWFSVSSSASATQNDMILVYDYSLNVWVSKYTLSANYMCPTIDTRSTPSHPITMLTGDYSGNVYEQDKGTSDASASGGAIDGYGTISILHGVDATDFKPACAVVPIESQGTGSLTVGYGFNGLTDVVRSTTISEVQSGFQLDVSQLDVAALGGSPTLRRVVPLSSNGRVYSTQLKFETSGASQPFTVHPVWLSDEMVV